MLQLRVRLTLTEEMLGTKAANKEVFSSFIASKAPTDDLRKQELETAEHKEEAGTTWFATWTEEQTYKQPFFKNGSEHKGKHLVPGLYDYCIRGLFKEACGAMRQADGSVSKGMTAHLSKIDNLVFIFPRFIPLILPDDCERVTGTASDEPRPMPLIMPDKKKLGVNERPLRANTAQGPRVSVVRSETVPAGTTMEFEIRCLANRFGKDKDGEGSGQVDAMTVIEEWLNYGQLKGLGCWRNASNGRFSYEILDQEKLNLNPVLKSKATA